MLAELVSGTPWMSCLAMQPRLVLNFRHFSCLCCLSAEITGVLHHTQLSCLLGITYRSHRSPQNHGEGMWTLAMEEEEPSFWMKSFQKGRCGSPLWKVQFFSLAAVFIFVLYGFVNSTSGPSRSLSRLFTCPSTVAGVEDIEPLFLRSEIIAKKGIISDSPTMWRVRRKSSHREVWLYLSGMFHTSRECECF